ncbi:MAG: T9SS type A sorting domain-containing protein [Chitinophagales bacterium]
MNGISLKITALILLTLSGSSVFAQCTGWANGGTNSYAWNITLDNEDNSYTAGNYQGPALIGNLSLADTGIFVIKYDSLGQLIWTKNFPCKDYGVFAPIHFSNNRIYLGFGFYDSVTLGNYTLTGNSTFPSIAVACLDPDGQVMWARTFACTNASFLYALWNNSSGRVLISGRYKGSLTMDGVTLEGPPVSGYCVYLTELDQQTGDVMWAKSSAIQPLISFERGYIIRTDAANDILLGGYYKHKITFDNLTLDNSSNGSYTYVPYIAKFDSSGNAVWLKGGTGPVGYANVYALETDAENNVYFSTIFDSTATIFGVPLDSHDGNIVIGKCSKSGDLLWLTQVGSHIPDTTSVCVSLHLNNDNTLTAFGWGYYQLIFDNDTLNSAGASDIFVCSLDTHGNYLSSYITGYINSESFYDAAFDENDHAYISGVYSGDTATLGSFGLHNNAVIDSFYLGNSFVWKNCPPGLSNNMITHDREVAFSVFPNPFKEHISINFSLINQSVLSLQVFNLLGQEVKTILENEKEAAGEHQFSFATNGEGIYFVNLKVDGKVFLQKIVQVR